MRILQTLAPAEFGGLEEVAVRLTGGLRDRGHEVVVAMVLTGPPRSHPLQEALVARGVDVRAIFLPGRAYRKEITAIRGLCREFRPQVVHTHGYRPDVLHRRAVRPLDIPMATTFHGFTGGGWKNRFYEWLQVRSARTFDAVVAVSGPLAGRLEESGVPPDRLHVIPNAWETRVPAEPPARARAALEVPSDRFHVGWVGRLGPEKAPDIFLDAVALLEDADVTASVIGDGMMRGTLGERAGRIRSPEIRFHGFVPDAGRLLAAFDVVVLSSRTEGTPILLFEAMAAGVPVVATAVGGVPDVVGPESAWLVPSEDPQALAEAIRSVRRNPAEARKRARQARALLDEKHAVGPWLDRYEALYAWIAANPPSR